MAAEPTSADSFLFHPLPGRWRGLTVAGLSLAVLLGICAGQGAYTFRYAEGLSYFGTDPKACVNCHIMQPQYDGWQKASHHAAATCVDCHLPHDFPMKYLVKAENGFWHSKGFTLQDFPEPIRMRPVSQRILQHNCLYCHEDLVHEMLAANHSENEVNCIHCHRSVGHGDAVGVGKYEPISPALLESLGPHHANE